MTDMFYTYATPVKDYINVKMIIHNYRITSRVDRDLGITIINILDIDLKIRSAIYIPYCTKDSDIIYTIATTAIKTGVLFLYE